MGMEWQSERKRERDILQKDLEVQYGLSNAEASEGQINHESEVHTCEDHVEKDIIDGNIGCCPSDNECTLASDMQRAACAVPLTALGPTQEGMMNKPSWSLLLKGE